MSIFVCGATGTQGGALVRTLHKANVKTTAITRDPTTPAAQALLQSTGVSLIKGDFDDDDALRQSLQGCTGAFLNFMPDLTDSTREMSWAKRILSIAKEAGVQHILYTTGFGAQDPQRYSHWDADSLVGRTLLSKQAIEAEVRRAGFKYWTILRPGNFMTNFLPPHVDFMYGGLLETGQATTALLPETILPMVDPNDIGAFGAAAFLDPVRFHAKEVEIASELRGLDDLVGSLARAAGRELKVVYMSEEEIQAQLAVNPLLVGQLCAREMVQFADMDKIRAWGIPLGTFEEFLEREKDRVAKAYST